MSTGSEALGSTLFTTDLSVAQTPGSQHFDIEVFPNAPLAVAAFRLQSLRNRTSDSEPSPSTPSPSNRSAWGVGVQPFRSVALRRPLHRLPAGFALEGLRHRSFVADASVAGRASGRRYGNGATGAGLRDRGGDSRSALPTERRTCGPLLRRSSRTSTWLTWRGGSPCKFTAPTDRLRPFRAPPHVSSGTAPRASRSCSRTWRVIAR